MLSLYQRSKNRSLSYKDGVFKYCKARFKLDRKNFFRQFVSYPVKIFFIRSGFAMFCSAMSTLVKTKIVRLPIGSILEKKKQLFRIRM
jgi:hypothetical protein